MELFIGFFILIATSEICSLISIKLNISNSRANTSIWKHTRITISNRGLKFEHSVGENSKERPS